MCRINFPLDGSMNSCTYRANALLLVLNTIVLLNMAVFAGEFHFEQTNLHCASCTFESICPKILDKSSSGKDNMLTIRTVCDGNKKELQSNIPSAHNELYSRDRGEMYYKYAILSSFSHITVHLE